MQRSLSTMLLALLAAPQPAALLSTNETLLGGIFLAAARPFERPSVASLLRACACFVRCILRASELSRRLERPHGRAVRNGANRRSFLHSRFVLRF